MNTHNDNVTTFLSQFHTPPKGHSQEDLLAKAQHWIAILQSPADSFELLYRRRNARRNLRRLLLKHPALISLLQAEEGE